MGLFPYGKPSDIKLWREDSMWPLSDRQMIVPTYPNGAHVNYNLFQYLATHDNEDVSKLDNRRDMAYAVQTQSHNLLSMKLWQYRHEEICDDRLALGIEDHERAVGANQGE